MSALVAGIPIIAAPSKAASGRSATWLTPRRFGLGLFGLITLMFWEVVLGSQTFVFRDYALFGYPLALHNREAFWGGEIPLWNPLNNSGLPYVAQWNTMVFYPLSLIYLLLPLPLSLGWFCLFHLFMAGLGMFQLADRWTGNCYAAAFAGISFAFGGLTLACLIWPNNIAAMGWLPWVWLLVERGWNNGRRDLLKAILAGTCQMLSGAPEVIALTWIALFVLCSLQLFRNREDRWPLFKRASLIVVLIAAAASVQLLPFLDLLIHSHRQNHESSGAWSIPLTGWANVLVPIFGCIKTRMGVYMQLGQGWTTSYYFGVGALVLAILTVWKLRNPAGKALGVLAGAAVLLASGDHAYVYSWLQGICPAIGFMRYPVKLLVIAAAIVPLLAGMALKAYADKECREACELTPALLCLSLGALGGVGIVLWANSFFPGSADLKEAIWFNGLSRASILIAFLLLLLALTNRRLNSFRQQTVWLGLLGITWLDLVTHMPNQNPTVSPQAYTVKLESVDELQRNSIPGQSRVMLSWNTLKTFSTTIVSNTFESLIGIRLSTYDNANLLPKIPKVDGFWSLYLPYEQEVRSHFYPTTNSIQPALADFLGVSHLSSDERFLDWVHRPSFMPMITSGQRPKFVTAEQTISTMLSPEFNPRITVILPPEAKSMIQALNSEQAQIGKQQFSRHRISAETQSDMPALIVVAQAHYHLWKAYVDGSPTPIWRANHAFQAIEVPAGNHQVELRYEDNPFKCGAWISSGTLLICFALYFRYRGSESAHHLTPLAAA